MCQVIKKDSIRNVALILPYMDAIKGVHLGLFRQGVWDWYREIGKPLCVETKYVELPAFSESIK